MQQPEVDSCYLCELEHEGLFVPLEDRTILLCLKCLLECIHSHPKMMHHRKVA